MEDNDIKYIEQEARLIKILLYGSVEHRNYIIKSIPNDAISILPELWAYIKTVIRSEKEYSADSLRINANLNDSIQLGILEALPKKNAIPLYTKNDEINDLVAKVLERYHRSQLILKLETPIAKIVNNELGPKDGLNEIMKVTEEISLSMKNNEVEFGIGEDYSVKKLLKRIFDNPEKIFKTGFSRFDEIASGFAAGDLVLLAAPSSNGKSMLMSQLAINMAELGTPTAYVSLEISPQQTWCRIFSNKCEIDSHELRDLSKITDENKRIIYDFMLNWKKEMIEKNSKLYVPEAHNFNIEDTINLITLDGCKAIFIDYINMMNLDREGNNQAEALQNATRRFKQIAKEYKCVIICAVQMDEADGRIRYSRAMKENCDFLWTWKIPNPEETKKEPFIVTVHIDKGRNTEKGDFELRAHFPFSKWTDQAKITDDEPVVQRKKFKKELVQHVKTTEETLQEDIDDLMNFD